MILLTMKLPLKIGVKCMTEVKIEKVSELINEISKVVLGKKEVIQLTVTAILAGGHVLFEDVPGVGKTLLVKTIAKALQSDYNRVQFTPDLLPNDLLGVSIFDQREHEFRFHQGPIFTSLLLADEINRTTPKTQAALLEAMAEKKITIDNQTYDLSPHFCVLATQNPIEFEGTYALPEAQVDRFLLRLKIGYPEFEDELNLVLGGSREELEVNPIINAEELTALKKQVNDVFVHEKVARYALNLARTTRIHDGIALGVSPRGSEQFLRAAKAYALTEGRTFVTPLDLQKLVPVCFGHRIQLKHKMTNQNEHIQELLEQIVNRVPVPIERK